MTTGRDATQGHGSFWASGRALALLLALPVLVSALALHQRERRVSPLSPEVSGQANELTVGPGLRLDPCFSRDGEGLYYAAERSGRFQICHRPAAEGSGADEVALTDDDGANLQPAVSPDGTTLAYHSIANGGIWLMPSSGGAPRRLTEFGCAPAWSEDGRLIAFESGPLSDVTASAGSPAPPSVIWIIPSAGGVAHPLTEPGHPAGGHGSPVFSPGSSFVTFVSGTPDRTSLWSVPRAGGEPARLAEGPGHRRGPVYDLGRSILYFVLERAGHPSSIQSCPISPATGLPIRPPREVRTPGTAGPHGPRIQRLALSPDGSRLSFASLSLSSELWSVPIEPLGGAALGPPKPLTKGGGRSTHPAFSPDGSIIAYTRFGPGSVREANAEGVAERRPEGGDIWAMRLNGSGVERMTEGPEDDDLPSFLPRAVAFLSGRTDPPSFFVRSLSTRIDSFHAAVPRDAAFARLSPDGRRYAFHSARGRPTRGEGSRPGELPPGGPLNVWVANVGEGDARQLTFDVEMAGFPTWSPDGRRLAIRIRRDESTHVALVSSTEGGEPDVLTPELGQGWPFSFTPDGDRIAYACESAAVWNVCWVSRTTRERRRVTKNEELSVTYRYPAWSPLGNQLVFERTESAGAIFTLPLTIPTPGVRPASSPVRRRS